MKYLALATIYICFFFVALTPSHVSAVTVGKTLTGQNSLNTGLVGWWTMDGADSGLSGGVRYVTDKSGNGYTASSTVASANPTIKMGKIGQAFSFNGSAAGANYIKGPHIPVSSEMTFSVWVYAHSLGAYPTIFSQGIGDTGVQFLARFQSGQTYFLFQLPTKKIYSSGAFGSFVANHWYHLVWSVSTSGDFLKFYKDGVLQSFSVTEVNDTYSQNTSLINIGRDNRVSDSWDGQIDDFRVYNRILSLTEIQQLYKQGGGVVVAKPALKTNSLNSGLVGWWTFDGKDCGATYCKDKSVNGTTATQATASLRPVSAVGKIGQAKKFDGANDYLQLSVGAFQSSISYTTNYTMSAWVYPTTNTVGTIFDIRGAGVNSDRNGLQSWNGAFVGGYYNGSVYVQKASGAVGLNKWHHVVLINTLGTIALYVDNVVQTGSMGLSLNSTDKIGGNADQFFNGSIDDARIYNRALSAQEIKQLYQQGVGTVAAKANTKTNSLNTGLVGWWTFDGADCGATYCIDKSGNGKIATSTSASMPAKVAGKIGQAVKFDGSNDYMNVSNSSAVFNPTTSISVSFWANQNSCMGACSASYQRVIYKGSDISNGTQKGWQVRLTSNTVNLYLSNGVSARQAVSTSMQLKKSYHIVGIINIASGMMSIYQDGVLKSSLDISAYINGVDFSSTVDMMFGSEGSVFYNGLIDDVRIWNRALSAQEVKQLYQMGK